MRKLNLSKTEISIVTLIALFTFGVLFNSVKSINPIPTVYGDETSNPSNSDDSDQESDSQLDDEDEISTNEQDELSVDEEDDLSTPDDQDEISTPSFDELSSDLTDEQSTPEEDEVSTPSVDEQSVQSGTNLSELDDNLQVFSVGENIAVIFEDEKLFFLIPVKIEKSLILDEDGTILDTKQSLLVRILDLLSF